MYPYPILKFTGHAEKRMQQRGISRADVKIVFSEGTDIAGDRILFTDKDARREIKARKNEVSADQVKAMQMYINDLSGLEVVYTIVLGEVQVITCYRRTRRYSRAEKAKRINQ